MTAAEQPVADLDELIARLRDTATLWGDGEPGVALLRAAADALAALADTVPREQHDALAAVIEQAPHDYYCGLYFVDWDGVQEDNPDGACDCWKSDAPSVSLARHDAQVKAQALDEAAVELGAEMFGREVVALVRARAAAIREEAGL